MPTFNDVFSERLFLKGVELKSAGNVDLTEINTDMSNLSKIINGLTGAEIEKTPLSQIHARNPTKDDDSSLNWKINSIWVTEYSIFICVDNKENTAVWKEMANYNFVLGRFAGLDELNDEQVLINTTYYTKFNVQDAINETQLTKFNEQDLINTTNTVKFNTQDTFNAANTAKLNNQDILNVANTTKFSEQDLINTTYYTKFYEVQDKISDNTNQINTNVTGINTNRTAIARNSTNISNLPQNIWAALYLYTPEMIIVNTTMGDSYIQDDGTNPIISQSSDHFRGGNFSDKLFNQSYGLDTFATHSSGLWTDTGQYNGSTTTKVYSNPSDTNGQNIISPWFQIQFRTPEKITSFFYKGEAKDFIMCYSNDGSNWINSYPSSTSYSPDGKMYNLSNAITATHWRFLERFDGNTSPLSWLLNYALYFYREKVANTDNNLINQVNANTTNIQSLSNVSNLNNSISSNTTKITALQVQTQSYASNFSSINSNYAALESRVTSNTVRINSNNDNIVQRLNIQDTQALYVYNIVKRDEANVNYLFDELSATNAQLRKVSNVLNQIGVILNQIANPFLPHPNTLITNVQIFFQRLGAFMPNITPVTPITIAPFATISIV